MPGIYGCSGLEVGTSERLRDTFAETLSPVDHFQSGGGCIGVNPGSGCFARTSPSGAVAAYNGVVADPNSDSTEHDGLPGTRASIEADGGLRVEVDPSGAFPLYYVEYQGGLVFSSHVRPLARFVDANVDAIGLSQFVRLGWTIAGRTPFVGIRRLLPGQSLSWSPDRRVSISETSDLWVGMRTDFTSPKQAAEEIGPLLEKAVRSSLDPNGENVLMASGGWDSRTLLAAVTACSGINVQGYSHGDTESRELRLAEAICEDVGIRWRARPIDGSVWDLPHLASLSRATETLIFPHWGHASRVQPPGTCLFSGVLGEVLGGHYGLTQVSGGLGKMLALASGFAHRRVATEASDQDVSDVAAAVVPETLNAEWYLDDSFQREFHSDLQSATKDDVQSEFQRLRKRGVSTADQLLEAFVTEHRGSHYVVAQALASRWQSGVAMPFAHTELLRVASRIPTSIKIHNRLNRAYIRKTAPVLLRRPMAATLVPAGMPILLQEASRAVRKVYGIGSTWLEPRSRGLVRRPRLSWVNFDWVGEPGLAEATIESLQSDYWDKKALLDRIERCRAPNSGLPLHSFYDQMGKILTIDHLLR